MSFSHAEDEAATIPGARLVQTDAPSHLYWLGPTRETLRREVEEFLRG